MLLIAEYIVVFAGMPEKMIPIHCPLCCDQPFEDQQSLFFHLRALRNNLFCTICSDRFDTFENLISHLSRKCNGPKSLDAKRKCLLSINLNQGVSNTKFVKRSMCIINIAN